MGLIAWLIVGAIGGYLGGKFVKGDEGIDIIGQGQVDLATVLVAAVGAVATVVTWKSMPRNTPTGGRVA